MREIKFRVFENDEFNIYTLQDFISSGEGCPGWRLNDEDRIGQDTGLKDKNGKEIYEGDILLIHYAQNEEDFYTKVRFNKGSFKADYRYLDQTAPYALVVGNIYENLELSSYKD